MPPGRPPIHGTPAQRAAVRRQKVRANVQAFRRRQREGNQSSDQSNNPVNPEDTQDAFKTSLSYSAGTSVADSNSAAVSATISRPASLIVEIDESGHPWTVNLPFRIDLGPVYIAVFMKAFCNRLGPGDNAVPIDDGSLVHVRVCCSVWLAAVALEAQSHGVEMLQDALAAVALNILGIEKRDPTLSEIALKAHSRSLRKLREAFAKFMVGQDSGNSAPLYATIITLSSSELLVNKSWENFEKHMRGIGALMQHEGPQALTSKAVQDSFFGYRSIQASFSLVSRRGSFLAQPEWIHFPWRKQHELANHPFHTLMDVAFQIPTQMEKFDSTSKVPEILRTQLQELDRIALQLQDWETASFETFPSIYTDETAVWDGLHDSAFEFVNADIACGYTFFAGVKTALCGLSRDIIEELSTQGGSEKELLHDVVQESLKWSRIVFQCLEYFFARNRKVTAKLSCLFPFDVAWETVQVLGKKYEMGVSRELLWCEATAKRLEDTGLPLLKNRHASTERSQS